MINKLINYIQKCSDCGKLILQDRFTGKLEINCVDGSVVNINKLESIKLTQYCEKVYK